MEQVNTSEAFTAYEEATYFEDNVKLEHNSEKDLFYYFNIAVIFTGIIGVIGNTIVLVILMSDKKMRISLSSTLIINQSVVDISGSLFLVVTYAYRVNPYKIYENLASKLACYLFDTRMLMFSSINASTFSLVAITIERYLMIDYPIMHRNDVTKKNLIILAALAWITGYVWTCAPCIPFVWVANGICVTFAWPTMKMQTTYGVIYVVGSFFIPMAIFIVAYSHMLYRLGKRIKQVTPQVQPQGTQQNEPKLNHAQVNITKTMVLITLAFAICWTPNQMYFLLFNLGYKVDFISPRYLVTLFLCFMNCCTNPFIYALKMEGIRRVLIKQIFKVFPRRQLVAQGGLSALSSDHTDSTITDN